MPERNRTIRVSESFEEADLADREEYAAMTPEQRLDILLRLVLDYYGPPPRLQRVLTIVEQSPG